MALLEHAGRLFSMNAYGYVKRGSFGSLSVCDACHSRKVKCDRQETCSNCADNEVQCQRERRKQDPKDATILKLSNEMEEVKGRLAILEDSVARVPKLSTTPLSIHKPSRKRTLAEAFDDDRSNTGVTPAIIEESSCEPSPFSTHEAQTMIEFGMRQLPNASRIEQEAFRRALSILRSTLESTNKPFETQHQPASMNLTELCIPNVETIQWMLQSNDSGRPVFSSAEFMPFVGKRTITGMALRVLATGPRTGEFVDPASMICVCAYAGYFLQEIVLAKEQNETGLEDVVHHRAFEYFSTARAWVTKLLETPYTRLADLQALTFGYMLAQEAGDAVATRSVLKACSDLCIQVELNKSVDTRSYEADNQASEAYYCFALCYLNDKGMALNLLQPPFLDDSRLDSNVLQHPGSTTRNPDNFSLYIELAQIQSRIVSELLPTTSNTRTRATIISSLVMKMNQIWQSNIQWQTRIHQVSLSDNTSWLMESVILELAFFSILTVIHHSSSQIAISQVVESPCLEAARGASSRLQKVRHLSQTSRYSSNYMKNSFVHGTILFYPFTPFFVLFCNVIQVYDYADYHRMQDFVDFLCELKTISDHESVRKEVGNNSVQNEQRKQENTPVAKLHALCKTFCDLAAGVLRGTAAAPSASLHQASAVPSGYPIFPTVRETSTLPHVQLSPAIMNRYSNPNTSLSMAQLAPQSQHKQKTCSTTEAGMPSSSQDRVAGTEINNDFSWLSDFAATQPMLQWLDADLSFLDSDLWDADDSVFS